MQHIWTKEELEVYINYCKLNNIRYESVWINLEDNEREKALHILHRQMIKINKSVKFYLNSEYINTINYSLLDFVQEETPNKLLTWIPVNFETRQEMVRLLEENIQKELQLN